MYWLEIGVPTPEEHREAVCNVFFEMGSGVQEEPASSTSGETIIRGYFAVDERSGQRVQALRRRVEQILGAGARLELREISGEDWSVSWREHFKPFRVGERLVVKPTWEDFGAGPEDIIIEIDPGLAFGCGTHPTTAMCLRLLERHVRPGMQVLDVGTGSAILAIVAARLGAATVWAVDEDPVAVRTARGNVAMNHLAGHVEILEGNLLDDFTEPADLIVANIVAEVLTGFCPSAARLLISGGRFILSGIVDHKEEMVRYALTNNGFEITERLAEGEWVALVGLKT